MRIVTLLALLVLTQAHADDSVGGPATAGDLYPVEHWRLQMIDNPCDKFCRDNAARTFPGAEHYTRLSCMRRGIERMLDALEPDRFGGFIPHVGFNCVYVWADDS